MNMLRDYPAIGIASAWVGAWLLDMEVWFRVLGFAFGMLVAFVTLLLKIHEYRNRRNHGNSTDMDGE